MAQLLIANGVDVNQTDEKGRSAADHFTSCSTSISADNNSANLKLLLQQQQQISRRTEADQREDGDCADPTNQMIEPNPEIVRDSNVR